MCENVVNNFNVDRFSQFPNSSCLRRSHAGICYMNLLKAQSSVCEWREIDFDSFFFSLAEPSRPRCCYTFSSSWVVLFFLCGLAVIFHSVVTSAFISIGEFLRCARFHVTAGSQKSDVMCATVDSRFSVQAKSLSLPRVHASSSEMKKSSFLPKTTTTDTEHMLNFARGRLWFDWIE